MKLSLRALFILLWIFTSCKNENTIARETSFFRSGNNVASEEITSSFPDNIYCANVDYFNPNTGTSSTYRLTVEVKSNEIININFPNGGNLEDDHFVDAKLDHHGTVLITTDKGYEYNVAIIGPNSNCFEDVPKAFRCVGITKKGQQCKNMTDNSNGLCWRHQDQE